MRRFAFPRRFRIVRAREIRAVLDGRRSAADDRLVVYVRPNGLGHPRLVFLVGRKHGRAHRRNRIKRLLREAFRLSRESLPPDLDLAVIPRVLPEVPALEETAASLRDVAWRAERNRRRRDAAPDRAD